MLALQEIKRPLLRYHGGKFILAKWIISHFPEHRVYVEPFGGAGSVLLQKKRSYAEVYNDMDNEVVNLFNVLRSQGKELITLLKLTPFSKVEFNNSYNLDCCPLELARRTCIRSFMGFGSGIASKDKTGFRANSNRSGSTPAKDWVNYPDNLANIIERLRGVIIENKSWFDVVSQHSSPQTLVYLDPPYMLETRYKKSKTDVYKHEFTDLDHIDLCEKIKALDDMVILSGYDNEIYNDILGRDWRKIEKSTFASGSEGAVKRMEAIWISPNIQHTLTLF